MSNATTHESVNLRYVTYQQQPAEQSIKRSRFFIVAYVVRTTLGPLEKISQCPAKSVKNPGHIWEMTSKPDGFSFAARM